MARSEQRPNERQQLLGAHVRRYRRDLTWSQDDLAQRSGVHRTYIAHLEQGRANVTLDAICRLALALDVDAADLVRGCQAVPGKGSSDTAAE